MPFESKVYRIFIASPSDVEAERNIIADVIQEWNDLHSFDKKIVLLPLRWETHSAPELGKRPQELINKDILDDCDMLIGVFWTRIGTSTGNYDSGTLEEIDRTIKTDKLVMLYFSNIEIEPEKINLKQYERLKSFKKDVMPQGIIENYKSHIEFRDKLKKQLELNVRKLTEKELQLNREEQFQQPILVKITNNNNKIIENLKIKKIICTNTKNIPDYIENRSVNTLSEIVEITTNRDFYREYIKYYTFNSQFLLIKFNYENTCNTHIRDIFIETKLYHENDLISVIGSSDLLKKPNKSNNAFSELYLRDSTVLKKNEKYYEFEHNINALQPKRSLKYMYSYFISSNESTTINVSCRIYADIFYQPRDYNLELKTEVEIIKMTWEEIMQIEGVKHI